MGKDLLACISFVSLVSELSLSYTSHMLVKIALWQKMCKFDANLTNQHGSLGFGSFNLMGLKYYTVTCVVSNDCFIAGWNDIIRESFGVSKWASTFYLELQAI